LVFTRHKKKATFIVFQKLVEASKCLAVIVICDWCGLSYLLLAFLHPSALQLQELDKLNVSEVVCVTLPSVHLSLMYFVFNHLKEITFAGKNTAIQTQMQTMDGIRPQYANDQMEFTHHIDG
jgi:hypothetical protein